MGTLYIYRVFSKGRNEVGPSKSLIFWTFSDVLDFFYHSIWAIFHSGTFETYDWKKSWKISSSKKVRFQGWLKLAKFWLVEFWGLPTLGSIISGISPSILKILVLILLQIFWSFWNSPNILNLHVFQGCYGQKPKKLEIRKYANLSQPWNLTFLDPTGSLAFTLLVGGKVGNHFVKL